jgi:hypothetical protein
MLKRVSTERLEPFFRLRRDANLNIVRNWMGLNTEESFYDFADKYGLLVWNDFWDSTQDYNIEPDDSALLQSAGPEDLISVTLKNPSQTTALATKLTLLQAPKGPRILPAYYSDNYISLLPNEQRTIQIAYPTSAGHAHPVIALRGWNITPATITP